jgi:hypothetical protein
MEHRWGERIPVNIPIRLGAPLFSAKRGRLTNLSLSGAFIRTKVDIRVLSRLHVVFELPRRPKKDAVTLMAFVARKSDEGIGIEWCEFAPRAVGELIRAASVHGTRENRQGIAVQSELAAVALPRRKKHGT